LPEPVDVAKAILLLQGRYVLQLRDDRPDIAAPNTWGLFGGQPDPGETPDEAIRREIHEELEIRPDLRFLWWLDTFSPFLGCLARSWVYVASVDDCWRRHRLREGQDVRAFDHRELAHLNLGPEVPAIIERFRTG
jgi:8-oxo-dGTP pyrophosphatase MutT (NUDIX family)